ncbi:MAG TPA: type 4 pilus major pilin [Noviherbaspirillum sp.]|nr:type 4 pilus major pilin [Noviherbaspirillum sp.]
MQSKKINHSGIAHRFSRQCGASLLEGIAYLGIAAIVVLGAVSLLTGAFGSAKANQTTEELIALRTSVRKLYAGQAYGAAGLLPQLNAARAVPNTLVPGANNTLTNGWAGAVTVTGGGGTFAISYANVPQDVCVSVLSGSNGWTQVAVNGAAAITVFPITAAVAAGACAAGGNAMVFTAT